METKEDIVCLTTNRETATTQMSGREIRFYFDVQYDMDNGETVKERISFFENVIGLPHSFGASYDSRPSILYN